VKITGSLFPYDANHKTFVNVYEGDALTQAILDRSKTTFEYFAGTRQGTFAVVRKFLPSGIHHILIGPDHLLFLIGPAPAGRDVQAAAAHRDGIHAGAQHHADTGGDEPRQSTGQRHRAGDRPEHHLRRCGQPHGA
jgi:hypothetical protein